MTRLSRSLAIGFPAAKDLMKRLEEANFIAEFRRGKGRRVLNKNLPSKEKQVAKSKDMDSEDLCSKLNTTVLGSDTESHQSHSETQPSQVFTLKGKKTSAPPPSKQQDLPNRVQKRLAKFDFSESQDGQAKAKVSIIKEPIVQKKRRLA